MCLCIHAGGSEGDSECQRQRSQTDGSAREDQTEEPLWQADHCILVSYFPNIKHRETSDIITATCVHFSAGDIFRYSLIPCWLKINLCCNRKIHFNLLLMLIFSNFFAFFLDQAFSLRFVPCDLCISWWCMTKRRNTLLNNKCSFLIWCDLHYANSLAWHTLISVSIVT